MITWPAALKISREKIAELRPATRARVKAWFNECLANDLLPYVYEGYRTCERQAFLYAKGRRTKGPRVTNAGPGQSMHQYREAVDFVPLTPNSKAEGQYDAAWNSEKLYNRCHKIAARHGLRRLSWETPHLENAELRDWKDARARYGDPC